MTFFQFAWKNFRCPFLNLTYYFMFAYTRRISVGTMERMLQKDLFLIFLLLFWSFEWNLLKEFSFNLLENGMWFLLKITLRIRFSLWDS